MQQAGSSWHARPRNTATYIFARGVPRLFFPLSKARFETDCFWASRPSSVGMTVAHTSETNNDLYVAIFMQMTTKAILTVSRLTPKATSNSFAKGSRDGHGDLAASSQIYSSAVGRECRAPARGEANAVPPKVLYILLCQQVFFMTTFGNASLHSHYLEHSPQSFRFSRKRFATLSRSVSCFSTG